MKLASFLSRMREPLPERARWFMAFLILLTLTMTLLHFRLQEHVQQEVRQMVGKWISQAGGETGDIRYRLLRGDISIQNVRLPQTGLTLHAARLYLHARLSTLAAGQLAFSNVRLQDLEIDISASGDDYPSGLHLRQQVIAALSLLQTVQHMQVEGLVIRVQAEGKPLQLASGRFVLTAEEKRHHIQLQLAIAEGRLEASGEWQRDEADMLWMQTGWKWQGVGVESILAHLGAVTGVRGVSDGDLTWMVNWSAGAHQVSGHMALLDPKGRNFSEPATPLSEADFTASVAAGHAEVEVHCDTLQLAAATAYAPVLHGRRLAAGSFSGDIHAESRPKGKQMFGAWSYAVQGELTDLSYQSPDLPEWRLRHVELSGMKLQMPERRLHVRKLLIADSDISFRLPGTRNGDRLAPVWRPAIEQLELAELHLGLQLAEGGDLLRMPMLHGTGSVHESGEFDLDMEAQEGTQQWNIQGHGALAEQEFAAKVSASGVPLVQLRPLLPDLSWLGIRGAPELAGEVGMSLRLHAGTEGVYVQGLVQAARVLIARAGTQLAADRVRFDMKRVALERRHISRIQVDGWYYQTALLPMDAISPVVEDEAGKQAHSWQIDRLALIKGQLSVGGGDTVWMRGVNIQATDLYAGNEGAVSVRAKLGEGAFTLNGTADIFSPVPRFNIHAKLRQALPFFLGDWFALSGAPRITRGRLNADFRLNGYDASGQYQGVLYLGLYHGQLETGVFPEDALLKLIGYSTQTIFNRLKTPARWWLKVPIAGDRQTPLSPGSAGKQVLAVIKRQAEQASVADLLTTEKTPIVLEHVSLHGSKPLTLNERSRLLRMLAAIKDHPKAVIDLQPQLGSEMLDAELIQRVRHTQTLIERYLHRQGFAASRIFPVWPQARHSTGEVGGIRIQALPG